jgi:hypothetical protein
MRYADLTEGADTDRAVRNHARRVMRDIISRAADELHPGAIVFDTTTRGRTPLPIVSTTTSVANLVVGICCTDFPFIIDLRQYPSTLPSDVEFFIALPGGRLSDVVRYFDGYPSSLDAAAASAWHVLTRYGHFLAASLQRHPDAFIHEFVHYTDFMRAAQRGRSLPAITIAQHGTSRYVNTPQERNAYYNEVFSKLDKKGRAWFQRPFETVLDDMMLMLNTQFVAHLTAANRRRLIARFYREWETRQSVNTG